jgi:hypothetical protein
MSRRGEWLLPAPALAGVDPARLSPQPFPAVRAKVMNTVGRVSDSKQVRERWAGA